MNKSKHKLHQINWKICRSSIIKSLHKYQSLHMSGLGSAKKKIFFVFIYEIARTMDLLCSRATTKCIVLARP